jgi:cell wall-associated NlpC family hydrolase
LREQRDVSARRRDRSALLAEYQSLPVEIPWADPAPRSRSTSTPGPPESVTVSTPYWINTAGRRAARAARTAGASARERAVFTRLTWAVRHGKARPEEVAAAAQAAVSAGVVRAAGNRWPPTAGDIGAWLVRWGIGVDCSGFVHQALERAGAALEQQGQAGLDRPVGGTITNVGTGGLARPGTPVTVPNQLRVGDLVYLAPAGGAAHIRIIEQARAEDTALVYTTVESSSTEHTPGATGAVRRTWRFPNAAVRANLQRWDGSRWVAAGARDRRAGYRRRLAGPNGGG